MNTIFNLAANIATPLALAGFLAAAFFFVAKAIISKTAGPSNSQPALTELLKHMLNLLFVLALIAMVLGFTGFVVIKFMEFRPEPTTAFHSRLGQLAARRTGPQLEVQMIEKYVFEPAKI